MTYTERWTGNRQDRGGTKIDLIVIHDEEGDSLADNLGAYLQRPDVQASYHLVVDRNGDVCRGVPDDAAAWAAGPIANKAGLHLCFTGRAVFDRGTWLARGAQMDAAARCVADWSTQHGIPLTKIGPPELNSKAGGFGVCGHLDVAAAWRETSHTDPGTGFPWDVLIDKARALQGGVSTTSTEDDGMAGEGKAIADQLVGPDGKGWPQLGNRTLVDAEAVSLRLAQENRLLLGLVLDQLCGPGTSDAAVTGQWAKAFKGWPQLGGRTSVDALAALGEQVKAVGK